MRKDNNKSTNRACFVFFKVGTRAGFIEKYFSLQTIWKLTEIGLVWQDFNKKKEKSDQKNITELQKRSKKTQRYTVDEDKVSKKIISE